MRREPRRSKGHTDNSRIAQAAALTATGLSTGHSAHSGSTGRSTGRSTGHSAHSGSTGRSTGHSAQAAAQAATGLSTGHSAQAAAQAATGLSTGHSAQATERRPQLQEAGIGFHSIQYDWNSITA